MIALIACLARELCRWSIFGAQVGHRGSGWFFTGTWYQPGNGKLVEFHETCLQTQKNIETFSKRRAMRSR